MSTGRNEMKALIIGASRGIGAGLAREFACRGWDVIATERSHSVELAAPAKAYPRIGIETIDIDDTASIAALAGKFAPHEFDLVFVNAGVNGPKAKTIDTVSTDEIADIMLTNAVAPIRVARAFLPLVKDGGTIALMTSILGSVAGRSHDTAALYGASKAALNSLSRGFAAETIGKRPIAVINFHPGWVKTDMGGSGAEITVETSVKGLADVVESSREPGHRYLDHTGKTLAW
jgi:NAD(P)-dependent dehydrogenase (short-subunit alcohol dehydrogenase family)